MSLHHLTGTICCLRRLVHTPRAPRIIITQLLNSRTPPPRIRMPTTMQHASSPPLDDHTSLTGSIGDFSDSDKQQQSPMFGLPSQHSGFRSADASEDDDPLQDVASDDSPWSPPAWRQPTTAGDWYRHQPYSNDVERLKSQSASKSRGASHNVEDQSDDEDDPDATLAARIPLPRGSTSPFRDSSTRGSVLREGTRSMKGVSPSIKEDGDEESSKAESSPGTPTTSNNCRTSMRSICIYH